MEFKGKKGELLKELHDYFRDKIVKGEYEVVKKSSHTWEVLVDGHEFSLWVANGDFSFGTYHITGKNFMDLSFRVEDRQKGWVKISKLIKVYESTQLKREKQKEINRLQKELNALNK